MKLFRNFSNEDFTWSWNGVPQTFKAGSEIYMDDSLAEHYAKHLVDREIQKEKLPDGTRKTVDDSSRPEFMAKALVNAQPEPELEKFPEEVQVANKNKRGRHKKEEVQEKKFDEDFEGLKDDTQS